MQAVYRFHQPQLGRNRLCGADRGGESDGTNCWIAEQRGTMPPLGEARDPLFCMGIPPPPRRSNGPDYQDSEFYCSKRD